MKNSTPHSYVCDLCKGKFQFKDIRYSSDGKKIVCINCYNQVMKSQKKKKPKITPLTDNISKTIKYRCMDCKYKFSLRKGSKVKLICCPYCGKDRIIKDTTISADQLIHEAEVNQ